MNNGGVKITWGHGPAGCALSPASPLNTQSTCARQSASTKAEV